MELMQYKSFNDLTLEEFLNNREDTPINEYAEALFQYHLHKHHNTPKPSYEPEELLTYWAQHEALHFFTGLGNTIEHEQKIAWYEKQYRIGFNEKNRFNDYCVADYPIILINSLALIEVTKTIKDYYRERCFTTINNIKITAPGEILRSIYKLSTYHPNSSFSMLDYSSFTKTQ